MDALSHFQVERFRSLAPVSPGISLAACCGQPWHAWACLLWTLDPTSFELGWQPQQQGCVFCLQEYRLLGSGGLGLTG